MLYLCIFDMGSRLHSCLLVFHLFFLCVEISAVQVKPLCPSVACSTEDLGANFHPLFITPIKRPWMENSGNEINDTSSGTIKESTTLDSTYQPDITQEDSQK